MNHTFGVIHPPPLALRNHMRIEFATPILYAIMNFKYDIFYIYITIDNMFFIFIFWILVIFIFVIIVLYANSRKLCHRGHGTTVLTCSSSTRAFVWAKYHSLYIKKMDECFFVGALYMDDLIKSASNVIQLQWLKLELKIEFEMSDPK